MHVVRIYVLEAYGKPSWVSGPESAVSEHMTNDQQPGIQELARLPRLKAMATARVCV